MSRPVALVTGGSRGIGKEVSHRFATDGWDVVVIATSEKNLEVATQEADAAGLAITGHRVDVSSPKEVQRLFERMDADYGRVDLVVNNAGIGEDREQPIWEAGVDEWWNVIAVNLRGPMLTMREAIPRMIRQGNGRVINIGSLRNITAIPIETAYAASKAGLTRLTETVNVGLADTGVRVFELSPGRVKTDIIGPSIANAPAGTWTPIERVAEFVAVIASGELDQLAGRFLHARDDIDQLKSNFDETLSSNGRVLTLRKAWSDDPLKYPGDLQQQAIDSERARQESS
jgi:NAD(P)-dependent dehydrogenase (short-subunit alcohol dehydrogenase family)